MVQYSSGLAVLLVLQSAVASDIVGMRPELQVQVNEAIAHQRDFILCDGGTRRLKIADINDDFCDCDDHSDEPGTAACAQGSFYCANTAYVPTTIFSSRVRDGSCDCCDGSDEVPGACTPNCTVLMQLQQVEWARQRDAQRKGYEARLELRLKGLERKDQLLMDKDRLKGDLVEHDTKVAAVEKEMEAVAELLDRLKAEDEGVHEAFLVNWRLQNPEPSQDAAKEDGSDQARDTHDEAHPAHHDDDGGDDGDGDGDGGGDGGDDGDDGDGDGGDGGDGDHAHDHDPEHLEDVTGDDHQDNEGEAAPKEPPVEYTEKTRTHMEKLADLKKQLRDQQGDQRDSKDSHSDIERKLETIEKYGPEYMGLDGVCVASEAHGAYTYEVCFLGSASQKQGRSTNLGHFQGIVEEDGAKWLEYTGGTKCYNGPSRSMKAKLVCGPNHVLQDTLEPSKCEYRATLITPLACEEVETIPKETAQVHEEL